MPHDLKHGFRCLRLRLVEKLPVPDHAEDVSGLLFLLRASFGFGVAASGIAIARCNP
jgi:hypothetical protein